MQVMGAPLISIVMGTIDVLISIKQMQVMGAPLMYS